MWMLRYACLALLAGCVDLGPIDITGGLNLPTFAPPGTPGSLGKIQFGYTEGCADEPFNFPCPITGAAITAGSMTVVQLAAVQGDLPVNFTVVSSNPGVFDIVDVQHPDARTATLQVAGISPGQATLTVFNGDASYDAIFLSVGTPTRLAFTDPMPILLANSPESVAVTAHDVLGNRLFGRDGTLALDAGGLTLLPDDPAADALFVGTDHAIVSGAALGVVAVTAHLGTATATAQVSIVDTSAVTQITTEATETGAFAFAARTPLGAEIRGAHCVPSVDAPYTLTVDPEGAAPRSSPGDYIYVDGPSPGTATVTCTLHGYAGTATVDL